MMKLVTMLDLSSSQTKPWLRKASVRSRVKRDLYLVSGDVFILYGVDWMVF